MRIQTSLLMIFLVLFMTTACDKGKTDNTCNGVTCLNGAGCLDGKCTCEVGFEGTDCGTLTREKYLATYEGMIKKGDTAFNVCTVTIAASTNPKDVVVSGLRFTSPTAENVPAIICTVIDATTIWHQGAPTDVNCTFKGDSLIVYYSPALPTPANVHTLYAKRK